MIANSRGSQYLAGAASLKYRMPAIVDSFPLLDSVAGSNPAPQPCCLNGQWKIWWALKDLNLRPTDYESAALTAELRARAF